MGEDNGPLVPMLRLVRCKECACMRKNPFVECGCTCKAFGFTIPDPDGFCAWGEKREDELNQQEQRREFNRRSISNGRPEAADRTESRTECFDRKRYEW